MKPLRKDGGESRKPKGLGKPTFQVASSFVEKDNS